MNMLEGYIPGAGRLLRSPGTAIQSGGGNAVLPACTEELGSVGADPAHLVSYYSHSFLNASPVSVA